MNSVKVSACGIESCQPAETQLTKTTGGRSLRTSGLTGSSHPRRSQQCSVDAELRGCDESGCCLDAIRRNDQRVLRLLGGDRIIVRRVRVLRLVPSASQTIDRLEAGHTRELRVHRFNDDDVAARRRPSQTLMTQQRTRCFPCCVVGQRERSLRVVGRCSSSGCDVTTGRLEEPLHGFRVSRHPLELSSVEQALDDFASFVPSRHLAEGIGP